MDLQYVIQYKKGSTNAAADALSRTPDRLSIHAVSQGLPAWLEKLQLGYQDDAETKQLLAELSLQSPNDKGYSLSNGIIKFRGRIWLGNNSLAQQHVMQALHASGIGGHSGIHVTYQRIKALFCWPKMKQGITKFV